jgi:VanZ family protein
MRTDTTMVTEPWFAVLFVIAGSVALWGMLSHHPRIPQWVHRHDKAMHFAAFAILAAFARGAWPATPLLYLWAALTLMGLLMEVLQQLLTRRFFCWKDALANAMGAAAMLALLNRPD